MTAKFIRTWDKLVGEIVIFVGVQLLAAGAGAPKPCAAQETREAKAISALRNIEEFYIEK